MQRGSWHSCERMRVLESLGNGFWRAIAIRDKYSWAEPGTIRNVESRHITQLWSGYRLERDQRALLDKEWQRAHRKTDKQAKGLVKSLKRFEANLNWTDLDSDDDGFPGEAEVEIRLPLQKLAALVREIEGVEEEQPQTPSDALAELLG